MEIEGKTVLVTGGASGLGRATARRLHGAGARVVVLDIDARRGESLVEELASDALFVRADVADGSAVQEAVAKALERFGALHAAVSCAGVVWGERILGREGPHGLESFVRVLTVNLVGTFNIMRLAASAMMRNEPDRNGERGVIVNTSSVAAFEGQVGQAAYATSKGGVASLTLPAARELGRHGIRVVAVAPGVFDTPMMEAVPESFAASLKKQIPFPPRFGEPEEYASLVEHIIANPMMNGAVVRIDGALRMPPR